MAGILAVAAVVGVAIGFGVHQVTSNDNKPARTQTTVLLSLMKPDGSAAESALLAHDTKTRSGVELLLPSRVITEVCGFGSQQLGSVLALPDGARLSRNAVTGLLGGVTVDGSWVLSTDDLSRLIDQVGGVTVDVDTDVITRVGSRRVLLVQRGDGQRLNGSRAVSYATYLATGEDSTANLARLQEVLDGLLAAMPKDKAALARLLSSLGPRARSTLGPQRLAALLVGLAEDVRTNNVFPAGLPVVKIDSGGQAAYRVDDKATQEMVSANLDASIPSSARVSHPRVLIQNGVGTPGLAGSACNRLVGAGFQVVGSGNAQNFNFATSKVLVFDSSVASAELGNRVARALRLPTDDVAVSNQGQNVADVIVILGKDYRR